jgi:hypothetical protein
VSIRNSIDEIASPMVRRIHAWWTAHSHGDIADRGDFDPAAFKDLLPNIILADVEHAPFRIRYRLVGAKVIDATGFNIAGRYLDEMMPSEPEAPWQDLYAMAYEQRRPIIGTSECTTTAGGLFVYEFGLFPLRKGGSTVDQFLAIEDYGNLTSTLTDLVQWRERATSPEDAG